MKENDAQLKLTATAGVLTANTLENGLRRYCFTRGYDLDLEIHKTLLQRVFLITIKLPYEDGEKTAYEIQHMFN